MVSKLMFKCVSPPAFKSGNFFFNATPVIHIVRISLFVFAFYTFPSRSVCNEGQCLPFVVIAIVSNPGISPNCVTTSTMSFRTWKEKRKNIVFP